MMGTDLTGRRPGPAVLLFWHVVLGLAAFCVLGPLGCSPQDVGSRSPVAVPPLSLEPKVTLFDPDPVHLWNRIYLKLNSWAPSWGSPSQLLVNAPHWPGVADDLSGESQRAAGVLLDEFITSRAERMVQDPLKRAIFQSNLWLLYDWAIAAKVTSLRPRLANVMRRVALTEEEIHDLPDNYNAAVASKAYPPTFDAVHPDEGFLPPDLLDPAGPWILLGDGEGAGRKPIALKHASFFGGRSLFLVFVRVPGDRNSTLAFVNSLIAHQKQLAVPSAPVGTHFALVRRILVLDASGRVRSTHLVESLQMRVYGIYPGGRAILGNNQRLFEFSLRREDLLGGLRGGLCAIAAEDAEVGQSVFLGTYGHPSTHSELPTTRPLAFCTVCHSGAGAVESFQRLSVLDLHRSELRPVSIQEEEERTIAESETQSSFKLLKLDWAAAEHR